MNFISKQSLCELGLSTLLFIGGYFMLQERLKSAAQPLQANITSNNAVLYLPSPLERKILDSVAELWPKRFSPGRPPLPEDLPAVYTYLEQNPYAFSLLNNQEIAQARVWSLAVNSGQGQAFLTMLDKAGEVDVTKLRAWPSEWKISDRCHLLKQELAFRLWQADQKKYGRSALSFLKDCDPLSPVNLWFELSARPDAIHDIKRLSLNPELSDYSRWLAEELFKVKFLFNSAD